jgi:putative ABC transport system ATP-binding protein
MDINILQISNSDCSVMQQSVNIGYEEVHMSYIEFQNVKKIYKMGDVKIKALNGADFSIEKGEFAVIAGASGAGKSTILNLMGGMDTATTGKIIVDKENVSKFSAKKLTTYRRYDIGFVFQFYNLVQNLTVRENVELATQICKNPLDIDEVIEAVGLKDRSSNFPSQLSGGEQQRVAIARALAKNPKLLLCDEPTGALDYNTGKQILKLLQDTCRKRGVTVVVITHNLALTAMGDKVIKVKNGIVDSVTVNENPLPVEQIEW